MKKILTLPFIGLIYIYRYIISPLLPGGCRHYPTCSAYAIDALKMHGLVRGGIMAAGRIARCQPWGTSGYDPVPKFVIKKLKVGKYRGGPRFFYPACNRLKHHTV